MKVAKNLRKNNLEIRLLFLAIAALFVMFLLLPLSSLLIQSFLKTEGGIFENYMTVLAGERFWVAAGNSVVISAVGAVVSTGLAFGLAYAVNYTNLPGVYKKIISQAAVLPMLLPTITYGFAIIYSFGKQGMITRIAGGVPFFEIYGFGGLLMGYVIYTLPISFMLIHNTMRFIDKKFMLVSRVMGDNRLHTVFVTILRPLIGTFAASFIQCFFLCFTDYGIPASVGGKYEVIASVLYNEMLGSMPDMQSGAVIAIMMLLPSIGSILLLKYLERYNIRYNKISEAQPVKNRYRDIGFGLYAALIILFIISILAVILMIPFMKGWPYDLRFSVSAIQNVMKDTSLLGVYTNSLKTSLLTALIGTLLAYGSALITVRSGMNKGGKEILEGIAVATNTIPGMVLGIAFLLAFKGSFLQNTFMILILCNIIHFFSTPYLMLKNSLEKMNAGWEQTAKLMGDTWLKTVVRIITPNTLPALMEVFGYYFVNAMVTVSAVIFLTGSRTMVITAKIKELQHFAKFQEIFILSLFILFTNIAAKGCIRFAVWIKETSISYKRILAAGVGAVLVVSSLFMFTGKSVAADSPVGDDLVVIHSNADDEAAEAMKKALDANGYQGKYIFQTFGTSELGGKILVEGENIEADLVTMSSFYLESAQEQNNMFCDLTFETGALNDYPSYYTPVTAQEGTIIMNPRLLEESHLPVPKTIREMADPKYEGMISVTDIVNSSTAWLLIQALIDNYPEEEAKAILTGIYHNAGVHIENSGSGPIKKVRAGETAVGFGLRHQAVADKKEGLPVSYSDPEEGNYVLTESVAVIDKADNTNSLAMEMAECIVKNGRPDLQKIYPMPLYQGERADPESDSGNTKLFGERLTADLLKKHQEFSEECKDATK